MKRKFLVTSLIIFLFTTVYCQINDHPYPNSVVDLGVGIGTNYGMIGLKTVIGYKGSGLLVGLGALHQNFAYEIGLQGSIKWWFINVGYGIYGLAIDERTKRQDLLTGIIIMTGVKINLLQNKRLFFEVGIGVADYGYVTVYRQKVRFSAVAGLIGLGYRIGGEQN